MTDPKKSVLAHDKEMARRFLAGLDPNATKFTFQFFGDGARRYAEIPFHGTLDEVWPKVLALNTAQRAIGVFVTINETDFKGRKAENIVRPRALFGDADGDEQAAYCRDAIKNFEATPSMIVKTGRGQHVYYVCADIPCDQFSALQESLAKKLGTDPGVKDLPRVMRLPGSLHLKDPTSPRLVELEYPANGSVERWSLSDFVAKMGLTASKTAPANNAARSALVDPQWPIDARPAEAFSHLSIDDGMIGGMAADIDEIRSAISSIPPSAIASEPDWMKLARGLAHEARIFNKQQAEQLWEILDAASRAAPGYDKEENRRRFERYMSEALDCVNPITIDTVFYLALDHGWQDWSPSLAASVNVASETGHRALGIADLPAIPPKRQWLCGNDLIRGAVSTLVAPGARAKTTWLLTCALACASGRDLLGAHVFGGPQKVLYLSAEDAINEIALRLRAAMQHYNLNDGDVPGLKVIGADQWGLSLLRSAGITPQLDQEGWDALTAELDRIEPDILMLDPLINLMGGVSVNDNSAAALLMGKLVSLAARRRIAVVIAHHAAKGRDPTSAESAMGAASFINLSRIALGIEPLDEKHAVQIGLPTWETKSVFRVIGTKQNFSPPQENDRWYRLRTVKIPNQQPPTYPEGDGVAVVEIFHPNSSAPIFDPQLVRDALAAVAAASPPLSPSKNSKDRYAAPFIAQAIAPHRGGRADEMEGASVLDHLLRSGLIRVDDVKLSRAGSRSDTRKGLILTTAGQVAMQQENQVANKTLPQSPQCPAETLQDHAGGDPLGPPQRQGGCGGNAGRRTHEADAPQTRER